MKSKNLLNYVFIIGLILLILNDHLLKDLYGNWLTGKLSDFAGLLILPMFIKYMFSLNTKNALLASVVFFIFWKSPFSQIIIDIINSTNLIYLDRVVDYTDLLAFLMLPLSKYVMDNIGKFEIRIKSQLTRKLSFYSVLFITCISFVATSVDDDDFVVLTPEFLVSTCCDMQPLNTNVGTGKIFIPTMFTPDGNGINDYFQVSVDANIAKINNFLIFDQFSEDTVFYKTDMIDFSPENGFDGVIKDSIIATQYGYKIEVTSADDITMTFLGKICCIPCIDELGLAKPENLAECAFSTQYYPNIGYNKTIDNQEVLDCFE